MNRRVVYTCITGGYDRLREPKFVSPSVDYICFTDNAALTSKYWKIKQIPAELNNLTDVKKQRLIKILPHKYLSEYDVSLWIDSNITIVSDIKDFFNKYDLSQKFLYTNKHPGRDCLYREQLAVIRLKKDTYENTNPQIDRYREEGFPEHYGLAETNIMLRSHKNPKCIKLMNTWGEEILRGSHRDQLSFNYCVWKCGVKENVEYLDEKYYNIHLADNAFFALESHIKMTSFKQFVDTREEENRRIAEELRKKQLEEEERRRREAEAEEEQRRKEEEIAKILEKDKEEERKNRDLPIVPVVIFTHNRTNVALETIRYLMKNLIYPKLRWIISDDRSEDGHIEKLISFFGSLGIVPIVCRTNSTRWGLGASMNNGLKEAFRISDFVLRCEDDWILEKKLDLVPHVRTMMANKEVVAIRLAMVGAGVKVDDRRSIPGYKILYGDYGTNSWIFNNQVCLVNKKIHDKIGWYTENTTADKEESEFKDRFNKKSNWGKKDFMVLSPAKMRWGTLDDPSLWFIHVGRSTLGHTIYREPRRFSWIYERKEEKKPVKKELQKGLDAESIKKLVAAKPPEVKVEQKIENKVESINNKIAQRLFIEKKKEIVIKKEAQKIVEEPKKKEEKKLTLTKKESEWPTISVMMTTHNRSNVACAVIDSLCKNLKYSGKIHWIISDDRSIEYHVKRLKKQFALNDISEKDISVCETDDKRFGLGASLNNGLKEAFKFGTIVMTTEDDWILHRELNLDSYVKLLETEEDVCTIRLAALRGGNPIQSRWKDFYRVICKEELGNADYVFNNQVALRHKKIYDKLGLYKEDKDNNKPEYYMSLKFNKTIQPNKNNKYQVLFPKCCAIRTIDDPTLFFIHCGQSTLKNAEVVPPRFMYLYKSNPKEMDMFDIIEERRKISVKNLYLVMGQLNSQTNEPLDSFTFFEYLQNKGVPSRYVIWKKHYFYEKLKKEGKLKDIIALDGNGCDDFEFLYKCKEELVKCKAVVQENLAMNPTIKKWILGLKDCKHVFLQHGISFLKPQIGSVVNSLKYINVASEKEKKFIQSVAVKNVEDSRFIFGGLPRFDKLEDTSKDQQQKTVFLMPTWRNTFIDNPSSIEKSEYFKNLNSLLSSASFLDQLKNKNIKLAFSIHHHLKQRIKDIDSLIKNESLEFVDSSKVQEYIKKSSLCITDYSSVAFDFLFLRKPAIFWNIDTVNDKSLTNKRDINEIKVSIAQKKKLFNVVSGVEELKQLVLKYADCDFVLEKEKVDIADSFFLYKKNVCEELYKGIENAR